MSSSASRGSFTGILAVFVLNALFATSLFAIKGYEISGAGTVFDVLVSALVLLLLSSLLPLGIWCVTALLRRRRPWPIRLHYLTTILIGGALVFGAVRLTLAPA